MTRPEVGGALLIAVAIMFLFFICAVVNEGKLKEEIIRLDSENFKMNVTMNMLLRATEKKQMESEKAKVQEDVLVLGAI